MHYREGSLEGTDVSFSMHHVHLDHLAKVVFARLSTYYFSFVVIEYVEMVQKPGFCLNIHSRTFLSSKAIV